MASVKYDHVTKQFGEVKAVNDLNLEVKDKEFLVLVGPSGCGKTTALRLLAGLEDITAGVISIGERVVNDVAPKDRDIAMVFQSYALYPHMSVYDNMAFGLKLRKMRKPDIDKRVKEAADILGIGHLLDRKPKQLSGGQRQRVAVGRAIVREPKVFLFDEPLSNLDAKLRVQTRAEISKLHQRLGTTFIYVTHDQTEAMTMASRIAVMKDGIMQQIGSPQELYDHPGNMFVAGFIGSPSMNFFNATIRQSDGSTALDTGSFRVPAPADSREKLRSSAGEPVVIGIRPEDIHDRQFTPPGIEGGSINATTEVVEPMGSEIYLNLVSGGQPFVARVDARSQARPGAAVDLVFDLNKIHIFSKDSEQAYR
jgi:multiple sugar transport system ATP-binding protein